MKDEGVVSQEIQIETPPDCILMRNNSGACIDDTGRLIRFGLGNVSKQHQDNMKSSDLIGITKVKITQEMVGTTLGVFTAIEVKKESWNPEKKYDKRETAQNNFINWVKRMGGLAGFANSVEMAKRIVNRDV